MIFLEPFASRHFNLLYFLFVFVFAERLTPTNSFQGYLRVPDPAAAHDSVDMAGRRQAARRDARPLRRAD